MAIQWLRGGSYQHLPRSSLPWSCSSKHLSGLCLWAPHSALVLCSPLPATRPRCAPGTLCLLSHAVPSQSRPQQRLCPKPEPSVVVASPCLSFTVEAFCDLGGQPVCKWQMPGDGQSPVRGIFLGPFPELFLMVSFQPGGHTWEVPAGKVIVVGMATNNSPRNHSGGGWRQTRGRFQKLGLFLVSGHIQGTSHCEAFALPAWSLLCSSRFCPICLRGGETQKLLGFEGRPRNCWGSVGN